MKKKLTSILNSAISVPLIAGALLAGNGCSKDPIEVLNKNKCEKTVHLLGKETYWNYAKQLRKKYPETIGKLDIMDVCMYIRDYNG